MLRDQFIYQSDQFWEPASSREELRFFRSEMKFDFLFEMLPDLLLPSLQVCVGDWLRAIDAYTQSQGSLVLVRQRNQTFITQHEIAVKDL